jgi:hypothetical protein
MQKGVDLSLPAEQRVLQIKEILLDNPKGPVGKSYHEIHPTPPVHSPTISNPPSSI